jgi:alkylated DNA repair protein alkB family protein 8
MSFHLGDNTKHLYLKPKSLCVFTGEARFIWEHSIALRKIDRVEDNIFFRKRRISLTFRKKRHGECKCNYISYCDSQKTKLENISGIDEFKIDIDSTSTVPTDIEKKHVYDVYDKIAPHFSHTRYKPWPKVAEFLNSLDYHSLTADVGCGNGKYLNVSDKKIYTIGTDRSINLLSICRNKEVGNQVFAADSLKLPFRSNIFDSVISIAVIHHFSNPVLRKQAINELTRITRVDGKILIYVWALEQDEKKFENQDNFVPWHLQNTYETQQSIETLGPQIIKEDKKNSTVYHRYYHVFKKGELEELLKDFDNLKILESFYDHANWCCIVRKIK